MLLIPTVLNDSPIHGLGVFVGTEVRKGEQVWKFDSRCDFRMEAFPVWLQKFVFQDPNGSALDGDNARFINHSEHPNLVPEGDMLIAANTILSGSELTVDYNSPQSLCKL